jgi:hypothetical protein
MHRRVAIVLGVSLSLVGSAFVTAEAGASPRTFTPKVQMGYYDGHLDAFISTDSSNKAEAKAMGINYSPGMHAMSRKPFPDIYMVRGTAATGQLTVLGSQPGEKDYSPMWNEIRVTWNQSATPVLLTSDTQIHQLATAGQLTTKATNILIDCPVIRTNVPAGTTVAAPKPFMTFYDGHKDRMLATDVGNLVQATEEHINYSPVLDTMNAMAFPEIYIVKGRAAKGQLMILTSQPGETSYNPLWHEVSVHWVHSATPSMIKSDTQVNALIANGLLKEISTPNILNCPVTSVS